VTKARMLELQAIYPVKAEYRAAVEAEIRGESIPFEKPGPDGIIHVSPFVKQDTSAGDMERCIRLIREDLAKYPATNDPAIGPRNLLEYFDGSIERFRVQYDFWKIVEADGGKIAQVYDIGTPYPFSTRYWATKGARVTFGCIGQYPDVDESTKFRALNLCRPPKWPAGDLVVITEVLEHLPCNVLKVLDWVAKLSRRWLVISFPLGSMRAGEYDADFPEIDHEKSHEHIREFTVQTSGDFIARTGFDLVADVTIPPNWVYRSPIRNVLLRRPE
jgi:hypothetical protein